MRHVLILSFLLSGWLFGCATGETEVRALGKAPAPLPVPRPAPPPQDDPAATRVMETFQGREPDMTETLKERGIPDRVGNDDGRTIWFYETPQGEEVFTFGKEGRFLSHEIREKLPGS